MKHDAIAVIDFGGQYAHLIANKVRRLGVLAEIRQPEDPIEAFAPYRGIIISGSPSFAAHGEESGYNKGIYDLDVPIVGFCFGHQEIAKHYGGKVIHSGRQWGKTKLSIVGDSPIFAGLGPVEQVWMSHYDSVVEVGPGFREIGYSCSADGSPEHRFAAIASESLQRYGLQFHSEVDDTINGERIIANFVLDICGCQPSWTMDGYLDDEVERIRERVGEGSVFLLASGGVDSTVAAALIGRALGPERLHLLHIDNGLMRKGESSGVLEMFRSLELDSHVHFVDASEVFLDALDGAIEPEVKRRIIGDTFVRVFQDTAHDLDLEHHLLGQGTIYPDTIETGGTKRAHTIKTHHNRVPIIEQMIEDGRVIEPLADLYKTEVRELGERLDIPHELVWRHPFPGPGLGVRLLCDDGTGDHAGLEEIAPAVAAVGDRFDVAAMTLPLRSVGVKADLRAYEHPVMLHGDVPWNSLIEAMATITADVPGINRCVWNLASRVPQTARPVAATVTRERLDTLREADHIVMEALRRHGMYDEIWQCPTVLVPLEIGYEREPPTDVGSEAARGDTVARRAEELIVVRPVHSQRAMTAQAVEFPAALLDDLRRDILAIPGVSGLALDITSKPPGTIEWE